MHQAGHLTREIRQQVPPEALGRLDPLVRRMLAGESVETQRQVVTVLVMMKNLAKDLAGNSADV